MDLSSRIKTRFLLAKDRTADTIGDPHDLLRQFEATLTKFSDLEPLLGPMLAAQEASEKGSASPEQNQLITQHRFDFLFKVKTGYTKFFNSGHNLFLALIQQYELPPKTRKGVEAAAKFYSKSRVQMPKRGKEAETYGKYLEIYREQFVLAKTAITQSQPRGVGEDTGAKSKKAGPFTIVNTGGFDEETMDEAAKVTATAAELLHRKGLGKVCYGEVLLSNTLSKSTVLAFYLVKNDEMFVRANLKGKQHDAVATIIHELGHRLQFKFLPSKQRDINHLYYVIANKEEAGVENNPKRPFGPPKAWGHDEDQREALLCEGY